MKDVSPTSVICERYTVCCLCCYATSDSPVSYFWTKNGQDPINDDIKVMNNNSIFITPRSAQDYGVYMCIASNNFGSTSYEITLVEDRKSSTKAITMEDDSRSNIYRIIVIAFSCIVFVLLVAAGVLTWRLKRALMNKTEKTQERSPSHGVDQHETPRDQHMSQGDEYLEALEVMPPATSHYQSLHTNNTSARYVNAAFNNETDNGQEDELYLTITP